MHEISLMEGVLDSVVSSAKQAGATKVYLVKISVGDLVEAIPDSLQFAFECLTPGTLCEGATLEIREVHPQWRCRSCGHQYENDRFHISCPVCGSTDVELTAGRELLIDSIEVETPDDDEVAPDEEGDGR